MFSKHAQVLTKIWNVLLTRNDCCIKPNRLRCVNRTTKIINVESNAVYSKSLFWWSDNWWNMLLSFFRDLIWWNKGWFFKHVITQLKVAKNNSPALRIVDEYMRAEKNVSSKCGCNLYIWMLLTHFCHYSRKSVIIVYTIRYYKLYWIKSNVC